MRKDDRKVSFQALLEMPGHDWKYRLRGVVSHQGQAGGGHYTSVFRDSCDQWFACDDGRAPQLISAERAFAQQGLLLFYERL